MYLVGVAHHFDGLLTANAASLIRRQHWISMAFERGAGFIQKLLKRRV